MHWASVQMQFLWPSTFLNRWGIYFYQDLNFSHACLSLLSRKMHMGPIWIFLFSSTFPYYQALKKRRLLRQVSTALSVHRRTLSQPVASRQSRSDSTSAEVIANIVEFYCRDSSSRLTTGRKETRTHKGMKEQIRYLNDSIETLWVIFKAEYPNESVGRTIFYLHRPFYVLPPEIQDRQQCGCLKCCNLQVNFM